MIHASILKAHLSQSQSNSRPRRQEGHPTVRGDFFALKPDTALRSLPSLGCPVQPDADAKGMWEWRPLPEAGPARKSQDDLDTVSIGPRIAAPHQRESGLIISRRI